MPRRDMLVGWSVILAIGLAIAYLIRPIFHGFVMFFYVYPLVWLPSLLIFGTAVAFFVYGGSAKREINAVLAGRPPRAATLGLLVPAAALAFGAFVVGSIVNAPLTGREIFQATTYKEVKSLPEGGIARLMPKEVAVQIASSGFNSPTERLTDFHVVRTPKGQAWTALQTPDGIARIFAKKTQGLISLDASSTERRVTSADAEFETAPGILITDNLKWRLLKRHYLIDLTDPIAVRAPDGGPLIVVPYLSYRGFLVRRPVLGGAFVVHPSGRIEDLSPAEARARPEVAGSGRLFPERLARRIHDAYAYKRGIWNRFVVHEEQTQISDSDTNQQPYLLDFGGRGAKWVSVAEPWGRAFAANSIMLTDAVTGETEIWRVPRGQSLSGNRRAIQTVRSVSIPGIVFADEGSTKQSNNAHEASGGRFKVVEPRPVFVAGRLVYLVSIIPESANSVSKSVIVDAARNKVVAIFDNDTDPDADRKTLRYLETGEVPASAAPGDTDTSEDAGEDTEPRRGAGGGTRGQGTTEPDTPDSSRGPRATTNPPSDVRRRIDRLIEQQREILEETERLREELDRRR